LDSAEPRDAGKNSEEKMSNLAQHFFISHACLYPVSIHMALPVTGNSVRLIAAYYLSIEHIRGVFATMRYIN